ncbi:hypothetical protein GCM10022223_48340 [Kineosporia mesophila]|uniref:Uncharacterized protein n=1 Tax=Kineosporia mesophila TaxID=566012 RepID=A0ABP7A615_9ACTN|nr:hypothetical protein [Kineosporia mesophila]MCD5351525.1 hypothetical protein [Kineosporia mesophila]
MDLRIGGTPLSAAQIALSSANPDGNPAGSQPGAGSSATGDPDQNPSRGKGFGSIADGFGEAAATDGDTYLTAMFEQYVNYRGPKRGTVENPFSPNRITAVQTVAMNRLEGGRLDVRV